MTLHKDRGKFVFECDACPDVLHTETRDFQEARDELTAEHWATRKSETTGAWRHYCPACKPKPTPAPTRAYKED